MPQGDDDATIAWLPHTTKLKGPAREDCSHTGVQGEEVDVEEEDGVQQQRLFMLQLLHAQ